MSGNKSLYLTAKKIILGEDYRIAQHEAIEDEFLDEALSFFKSVVEAKFNDQEIDRDWYQENFLNNNGDKKEIALYSGLNMKTVGNIKGSQAKDVVLDFANEHYEVLKNTIDALVEKSEFNVSLELSFKKVTVKLNSQESLIVINALTVLRSKIRGGAWSKLGKGIEIPLMMIFVKLLDVEPDNYFVGTEDDAPVRDRETDFFFVADDGDTVLPVEIKLMGRGNPESADGAIARDTEIFFAYKLSDSNKKNLEQRDIDFIELTHGNGLRKLSKVLDKYGIEHTRFKGGEEDIDEEIDEIIEKVGD